MATLSNCGKPLKSELPSGCSDAYHGPGEKPGVWNFCKKDSEVKMFWMKCIFKN